MDPGRWSRIDELFNGAQGLSGAARFEYLRQAAGGDESLIREVEKLLAEDGSSGEELQVGIEEEASEILLEEAEAVWQGKYLGPWRISGLLGQGGMGTVY